MEQAIYAFKITGTPISCELYGSGRINSTYLVHTDAPETYVLQEINTYVFKKPLQVMANIGAVTNHLRNHDNTPNATLQYLQTKEGLYCYEDDAGTHWRMYRHVPGIALDAPQSDEDLYQSALAFGRFQELLSDFPADTLFETIPNFHNTIDRYRQLKESIAADKVGRVSGVRTEIDYLLEREELAGTLQRLLDAGELPLRVTHNDTKLNNVLLDPETRKSICVLDLDTVMPGLSLYDYGDSIRFGAATSDENETDMSKVGLDLHLFEVYTKGFLEAVPSLTKLEIDLLPMGALIMTLELVVRFLTDYLDGDLYFKVTNPEDNLTRARNQLALAADMEKKLPEMNRIVAHLKNK